MTWIFERCGCQVINGIPWRCKAHLLPIQQCKLCDGAGCVDCNDSGREETRRILNGLDGKTETR